MRHPFLQNDEYVFDPEAERNQLSLAIYMIEWLKPQSQHVWGWMILGNDGLCEGEESGYMLWLIDQPDLSRANAVRLFWRLFKIRLYLGNPEDIEDVEHDGPVFLSALGAIMRKMDEGFYKEDDLGISEAEAQAARHYLEDELPESGLQPEGPLFEIGDAFLRSIPGRELKRDPDVVPIELEDTPDGYRAEADGISRDILARAPNQFDRFWIGRREEYERQRKDAEERRRRTEHHPPPVRTVKVVDRSLLARLRRWLGLDRK